MFRSKKVKKRTIDEQLPDIISPKTNAIKLHDQTRQIKKKKKLKAKRISKTQSSGKIDSNTELVTKNHLDQSIKSEKLSFLITNDTNLTETIKKLNPNKKIRLTQECSNSSLSKKKAKIKTKKSSVMSKKSSIHSAGSVSSMASVFNEFPKSAKFEFKNFDTKTPMKRHTKLLNSIMESNSKTIKAEKRMSSLQTSGKVKQMVEIVEARMKTSIQNTPSKAIENACNKLSQYSQSIQNKKVYFLYNLLIK